MPRLTPGTSRTWFSYERIIAPGWKAVIWLLSWSVVMKAWGVTSSGISLTWARLLSSPSKYSRYGPKYWHTVAIGTGSDRTTVVKGKSGSIRVALGGTRRIKKKKPRPDKRKHH